MSEVDKKPKINPSLQKRTAARMAAVQCLYTLAMSGETFSPAQQVQYLKKQLGNNRDEQKLRVGAAVEPNYKLVETLLAGVEQWEGVIETRMQEVINGAWKRERMSPLLTSILQCAIFEMFFDKDLSPKIIIDEYTRLTRSFFGDGEVDFVHGALSRLARTHGAKLAAKNGGA